MAAHILIVDDSAVVSAMVTRMLSREGYTVQAVNSGQAALELVPSHPPDLILLDVVMPDPDGLEVCRRLKHDARTAPIPIILMTGLGDSEQGPDGNQAGADDVLAKPFTPQALVERVQALLA